MSTATVSTCTTSPAESGSRSSTPTPSDRTRPGVVMLGRPLPVGDTYRAFSGFVEVPRALIDDLLRAIDDGDARQIASVFGETLRPPRLQNTDGEDLVFHTIRWRVGDPDRVGTALEQAGLQADAGEPSWRLVRDSAHRSNTSSLRSASTATS